MTESMKLRLVLVVAAILALILVATQAFGSSQTEITQTSAAQTDNDAPDGAAQVVNSSSDTPVADNATTQAAPSAAAADTADTAGRGSRTLTAGLTAQRSQPGDTTENTTAQIVDETVTVTLLHNNDGESKLLADIDGGFPGIARFAQTWVDLGRSSNADILLRVSSGDNFLASKEFSAGLVREGEPLYDSIALRGLYEAIGLGNHDFDFGPDVTARFIEGFMLSGETNPAPFLAANIDVSGEPALQALAELGQIAPSFVYTDPTSSQQIGVIGAITPRLSNISSPRGVVVDSNVAESVNAQVELLQDRGVDRIVLLSHLQGLDEDRALIPSLSGVDIVVAGGGDELLKNDGDSCQPDEEAFDAYPLIVTDADGVEVPVVTTPGGYRCIGRLDVTFDQDGAIVDYQGSSFGVPLAGEPEEFARTRVEEPLIEALAELNATVIAESDVDLDGRRSSVRTGAANVGELLADALLVTGDADVAVQNGGGIRNDSIIAAGEITLADTFDIAPFANFAVNGEISREQFKDMLEVGVAGLPGAEGTFPQIAGFSLEVDASQPAREVDRDNDCALVGDTGSRIRSVTLDGGAEIVRDGQVVPGEDLVLATIDFLANGGDCYPLADIDFTSSGTSYQQALAEFIDTELDGSITSSGYPEGGSRITVTGIDQDDVATDSDDGDTDPGDTDPGDTDPGDTDPGDTDSDDTAAEDAMSDDGGTDAGDDAELPNTGIESWLFVIVALTAAIAGLLIAFEAQRAGLISLTNRLTATRAWIPIDDPDPSNPDQ